jgi:putative nucleotidyltransferase with HDIG domain
VTRIPREGEPSLAELPVEPTAYAGLVLDRLARQACEVLDVDQSCIMVRSPENPHVAIAAAAHGMEDELLGSQLVPTRGPVGRAFTFGRAAAGKGAIADVGATRDDTRVTASAPIGSRPRVRGALSAATPEPRRRFSRRELGTLGQLAGLAGDALESSASRSVELESLSIRLGTIVEWLDSHDRGTGRHSAAVVGLAVALGDRLGLSRASLLELELAALLHDLGKLAIPAEILCKPAPLDAAEREIVQQHPVVGAEILRRIPGLEPVATIVRYHHERWDGQGYPDGLGGERIPLASRVVSVCDGFHAMTSDRPYRTAVGRTVALLELRDHAGTQFDPRMVDALEQTLADGAGPSQREAQR